VLDLNFSALPEDLLVGTSSFGTDDWRGVFYPAGLAPAEYLRFYAARFATVEIDATWYSSPSRRTVEAWVQKVPDGFVFSAKVPRSITHDRYLEGCDEEWSRFLEAMDRLGEKRGPLLFQFPYVAKGKDAEEYRTGADFRRRLAAFLPKLPTSGQYVVEVRNEKWIADPLLDLLRAHNVALAFVHYYTMPTAASLLVRCDPVTADFAYIRFLGHHNEMDRKVAAARAEGARERDWERLIVDRTAETRAWIGPIRELLRRGRKTYVYFNNHFAGFAPGSIELFLKVWREMDSGGAVTPP
jgi:uncharacterized protein YecE (DUF72 family)